MSMFQTRMQHPIRFRKARADAKIGSVQTALEDKLGFPYGCLQFVDPTGRKLRRNMKVARLRKMWGV
jgi:hypothetical protein